MAWIPRNPCSASMRDADSSVTTSFPVAASSGTTTVREVSLPYSGDTRARGLENQVEHGRSERPVSGG